MAESAGSGEILPYGGVSFAQSLVKLDLVDEYRLTVFRRSGRSLFAAAKPGPLDLVSATPFGKRTAALVYRRQR